MKKVVFKASVCFRVKKIKAGRCILPTQNIHLTIFFLLIFLKTFSFLQNYTNNLHKLIHNKTYADSHTHVHHNIYWSHTYLYMSSQS